MTVFKASRRVAVPPDVAFSVAADVESYQQFLPLLSRSVIRGAKVPWSEGERFEAELTVAYPKLGLQEAFVSSVETNQSQRLVTSRSEQSPFRNLFAQWRILEVSGGADIAVMIDYAFRNPLLQMIAGGLMDHAVQKVMSAFEARATSFAQQRAV